MITNMDKNVKLARINAGLSQSELAESIGLSVDTIKKIEQGALVGSLETFCKLCEVLDVSPNYLLKDDIVIADMKAAFELSDKFINLSGEQLVLISAVLDKINKAYEISKLMHIIDTKNMQLTSDTLNSVEHKQC